MAPRQGCAPEYVSSCKNLCAFCVSLRARFVYLLSQSRWRVVFLPEVTGLLHHSTFQGGYFRVVGHARQHLLGRPSKQARYWR